MINASAKPIWCENLSFMALGDRIDDQASYECPGMAIRVAFLEMQRDATLDVAERFRRASRAGSRLRTCDTAGADFTMELFDHRAFLSRTRIPGISDHATLLIVLVLSEPWPLGLSWHRGEGGPDSGRAVLAIQLQDRQKGHYGINRGQPEAFGGTKDQNADRPANEGIERSIPLSAAFQAALLGWPR